MKQLMQLLRDNAQRNNADRKPLALVKAQTGADSTLYLYDVIDSYWGVSAKEIVTALAGADPAGTVHLRINSPGGDVFEARAMATALSEYSGKVVAHIDALAASAATTVALACDEIVMAEGSYFMIHNAWSVAYGDKSDFTDMAALLAKIDGDIAGDYAECSGASLEQVTEWMDAETWFTAEEALAAGFADRIAGDDAAPGAEPELEPDGDDAGNPAMPASNRAAGWNLDVYRHAPKALTTPPPPPAPATPDWAAIHTHNRRRLRLLQIV